MVTRVSVAGLFLLVLGLLIVVVHALNMSEQVSIQANLRELGIVLVGLAVQLLGLGMALFGKK